MQLRLNKPGLENTTGKDIPVPMQLFYHGEQKVIYRRRRVQKCISQTNTLLQEKDTYSDIRLLE